MWRRVSHEPRRLELLLRRRPPPQAGSHAVQVLRTYPARYRRIPFAPDGERSIARAYLKALGRARSLVYIEDQYLWGTLVADALAAALRRAPELRMIIVVPRHPDRDGRISGRAARAAQWRAIDNLAELARAEQIELFVVGLPRSLSGDEGPSARRARRFAQKLALRTGLRVEFYDEWLSTREAKNRLREQGIDERAARERIDSAAAAVVLQSWLDGHRTGTT